MILIVNLLCYTSWSKERSGWLKTCVLESYTIAYDDHQTDQCPTKITEQLFIEKIDLPRYFIATVPMSFYTFYQADCPNLVKEDYYLSENFQKIIERFPHTNTKAVVFDGTTYQFTHIPVAIDTYTYLQAIINPDQSTDFLSEIAKMEEMTPFVEGQYFGKRKELLLNGQYTKRKEWLQAEEGEEKRIQAKLAYVNEMYSFGQYSYAAMVEFLPEYGITTYEQFHEAYGQSIYSVTLTKNNQTIPLLWPDYLYHKPENHLEFGVLANDPNTRYTSFNQWKEGDIATLEILADGFEDVHFQTSLKKPLSAPPTLTKKEYLIGETITLALDNDVIEELDSGMAQLHIVSPKRTLIAQTDLIYETKANQLLIPSAQLGDQGRFQLKIVSQRYGQLLLLFTLRKDKPK